MAHYTDAQYSVNGQFVAGNAALSQPGTQIDASWLNDVQGNLNYPISQAGIPLVKGDYTQLYQAIQHAVASAGPFVSQGGGTGMSGNKIALGWNAAKILAQVDTLPMGALALELWTDQNYFPRAGGTITGDVTITGGDANQLRLIGGSVGAIFRNDGANLYLMTTNVGDPLGSYNALRPFRINLSSGTVSMDDGLSVNGMLQVQTIVQASSGTLNLSAATVNVVNQAGNALASLNVAPASANTHAVSLNQFGVSKTASGFMSNPQGMFVQWGRGVTSGGFKDAFFFPVVFPNACMSIVVSEANAQPSWSNSGTPCVYGVTGTATNGFFVSSYVFLNGSWTPNGSQGFSYIAIGY